MRLADAHTMRNLDKLAIEDYAIPGVVLMENAGRATFELLRQKAGSALREGVSILCGKGNNGGDGFVVARHLHNQGIPVQIFLFARREELRGDAAINAEVAIRLGIPCTPVLEVEDWRAHRHHALAPPFCVDALLGTGLSAQVSPLFRLAIEDLNGAKRRVLAVDIPSGLDSWRGVPQGMAVRATWTATYGLAKLGLVQDPALEYVGELHVIDISLPRVLVQTPVRHDRLLTAERVALNLPSRPRAGHKGTFGHVAVVAGSKGKGGAAVLTAHAALRAGAGLVTLLTPRSTLPTLAGIGPELMVEPIEDQGMGHFQPEALPELVRHLQGKSAVALGPGLSAGPAVRATVEGLLQALQLPMVLDADGLNVLQGQLERLQHIPGRLILTPHPGEAARLLGWSTAEVGHQRPDAARLLARQAHQVVVLKGARSVIAAPDGRLSINSTGNSGMATGGSGDVLTGVLAGLLAQGLEPEDAACVGVFAHGLAGDLQAEVQGQRALVAGDVVAGLGHAWMSLETYAQKDV
ncbi:MAG: NAD(P)H-hydrate dehydratase [Myxococcota bacterium]